MNILIVSGNLGQDPETRFTPTGTAITNISIAVKSGFGDREKTQWVKGVLFGKKGANQEHGLVKYLVKGMGVTVSGEFSLDEWEGQDGQKRTTAEIAIRDIVLPPKGSNAPQARQAAAQDAPPAAGGGSPSASDFDDDIPFAQHGAGEWV